MATSIWGVEHGVEDISKAEQPSAKTPRMDREQKHVASSGLVGGAAGPAGSAIHSGATAKKGKKLRAVGNAAGGSALGGILGGAAGIPFGRKGQAVGSITGSALGSTAGAQRNLNQGYVKKSVWDVDHGVEVSKKGLPPWLADKVSGPKDDEGEKSDSQKSSKMPKALRDAKDNPKSKSKSKGKWATEEESLRSKPKKFREQAHRHS